MVPFQGNAVNMNLSAFLCDCPCVCINVHNNCSDFHTSDCGNL